MKQADDADQDSRGVPKTLGGAIKEGRTRLGLSQRALAAKMTELGVPMDATAVTRLENNQREPRFSEGVALSRFLGLDVHLYAPGGFSQAGWQAQVVSSYGKAAEAISELKHDTMQALVIHDILDKPRRPRDEVLAELMDHIVSETEFDGELWVGDRSFASSPNASSLWEMKGAKMVVRHLLAKLEVLDDDSEA